MIFRIIPNIKRSIISLQRITCDKRNICLLPVRIYLISSTARTSDITGSVRNNNLLYPYASLKFPRNAAASIRVIPHPGHKRPVILLKTHGIANPDAEEKK